MTIRDLQPGDDEGVVAVARAFGFHGVDTAVNDGYRAFIAGHGRFVVAEAADEGGSIVGFGGALDVGGARMVTDLFLLPEHQGRGLGGGMLRALVGHTPARMTFSSSHERALPGYARLGMLPRWKLQYWLGRAPGGDRTGTSVETDDRAPIDEAPITVVVVDRVQWAGDRPDLADHWAARGGQFLHLVDGRRVVGWSIVAPAGEPEAAWTIARLQTTSPHDLAVRRVLAVLPAGESVLVCVPERSAAGAALRDAGFELIDHDTFSATDGVDLPTTSAAVHPGMA